MQPALVEASGLKDLSASGLVAAFVYLQTDKRLATEPYV